MEKRPVPSSGYSAGYDGGITMPGIFAVILLVVIGFIWAFCK